MRPEPCIESAPMLPRLRCATFNLKGIESGWFEGRFESAKSWLKSAAPDILCLQESTLCRVTQKYDQALALGEAIGLEACAFAPYGNEIETMSHRQGGIAILSRWPMRRVRHRRLPPGHGYSTDGRVAILAQLETPAGLVWVINTHLSWKLEEAGVRLTQMGVLLSEMAADHGVEPTRTLLCGDFNAVESEPAVRLTRDAFLDSFRAMHPDAPGYTWSSYNPLARESVLLPDRRIDYILCSRDARVLGAEVILNEPRPVFASDHFGVLAELEWYA